MYPHRRLFSPSPFFFLSHLQPFLPLLHPFCLLLHSFFCPHFHPFFALISILFLPSSPFFFAPIAPSDELLKYKRVFLDLFTKKK